MYNNNFIDGLLTKEKKGNNFIKVLKFTNFLMHLLIIGILFFIFLKYFEINNYNNKITKIKADIEQKRDEQNITETEIEWESWYYKILAIKEQVKNSTNFSYVLKDLGTYMPSSDFIISMSLYDKDIKLSWFISKEKLKTLISFYDYAAVLNSAFEKSEYIENSFLIETMEKQKIYNNEINALKIKLKTK